jgi:hypothetical protein
MARRAHITALVLSTFLLGLAAPTCLASTAECVRAPSVNKDAGARVDASAKDGGRVVSQQKTRAETKETKPAKNKDEIPSKADGPMAVYADIENGWRENKVDKILRHFGRGKVTLSIEGTGPSGGQFSRNQSYYLLKDLFKYTITRKFEFVQYRKPNKEGKTTFAVAERHYQKRDDGRLFKDKIYVSLHLERSRDGDAPGEHWVIDEIKSIR